jgi:hypothetical protein
MRVVLAQVNTLHTSGCIYRSTGGLKMKAAELVCVNCKNWQRERCGDCISTDHRRLEIPQIKIDFTEYVHVFITPEEYEKRTVKKWTGAVWILVYGDGCSGYGIGLISDAERIHCPEGEVLICNGPEVPGDDVGVEG